MTVRLQVLPPGAGQGIGVNNDNDITRLLLHWRRGDDAALDELTPLVYDRLRALAGKMFRSEADGHTLQPTALVNELFQRLIATDVDWHDRNHFYALSARMMRRILVNHANARKAAKRGGDALRVTLDESQRSGDEGDVADIIALDTALEDLHAFDERKARILEMHYFAGLTYAELADVEAVAESTVHQDLRTAKAWLRSRLAERPDGR